MKLPSQKCTFVTVFWPAAMALTTCHCVLEIWILAWSFSENKTCCFSNGLKSKRLHTTLNCLLDHILNAAVHERERELPPLHYPHVRRQKKPGALWHCRSLAAQTKCTVHSYMEPLDSLEGEAVEEEEIAPPPSSTRCCHPPKAVLTC